MVAMVKVAEVHMDELDEQGRALVAEEVALYQASLSLLASQ